MARGTFLTLAAMLGLAAAAHASDGVIEINQTKALTGGVTPGDTPGFPVLLTQSGSYRLTSSLDVPASTTGIVVNNTDTTLDLNGFTIESTFVCCAASGSGTGIQSTVSRITVRDGIVQGFGQLGVQLGGFSHVEGVMIREVGGDGIELGAGSIAHAVRVHQVGQAGLRFTGSLLPGTYGDAVLGTFGLASGSSARALEGLARSSGGNVCSDGSCSATGTKRFYLSRTGVGGANADTQCISGFHIMTTGEFVGAAAREYAEDLPEERDLLVPVGPPSGAIGWVQRNGADCLNWSSSDSGDSGTSIVIDYDADLIVDTSRPCNADAFVWCAED